MRLADVHAHRQQISARRQLRRFRFNMAETVSSAARSTPSRAGWTNSDSPEKEEVGDDAELLQGQMQLGTPREENAELVAEVETVAAGWMLDFLSLSLCRAFRDGRSEDFCRTRDSAEGECGLPGGPGAASRPETCLPAHTGRDHRRETARNQPPLVSWKSSLPPARLPCPRDRMFVCFKGRQPNCYPLFLEPNSNR